MLEKIPEHEQAKIDQKAAWDIKGSPDSGIMDKAADVIEALNGQDFKEEDFTTLPIHFDYLYISAMRQGYKKIFSGFGVGQFRSYIYKLDEISIKNLEIKRLKEEVAFLKLRLKGTGASK